ncbi:hypothetical protein AB0I28_34140 [Phytomonospora sp. NPDC050363]|uniref:hypothetical protein n=1 Tax=Phytomonospora sp. NPDC050363 TaxID=3155642 RepID=UPI0033C08178
MGSGDSATDVGDDTGVKNSPGIFDGSGAASGLPGYAQVKGLTTKSAAFGDGADFSDVTGLLGEISSTFYTGLGAITNPANFLAGTVVSFLIDFIQPLEDLLGLVTGNPERMDLEIAKWDRVAAALNAIGEDVGKVPGEDIANWRGDAAGVAKTRLGECSEAITATANDVTRVRLVMQGASLLATSLQSIIKGELTKFLLAQIPKWLTALAAAGPSMGASTAAQATITAVEAARTYLTAVTWVRKAMAVFEKLQTALKVIETIKYESVIAKVVTTGADMYVRHQESKDGPAFDPGGLT